MHARIIKAEPLDDSRAKIVHQHICLAYKLDHDLAALAATQIDREAALIAVQRHEVGALPSSLGYERIGRTAQVAHTGPFNLHDLGTEVTQDLCGARTELNLGQIYDPDAVEG